MPIHIVLAVAVSSNNLVPLTGQWVCNANQLYSYLLDRYWGHAGQLLANREEKCDRDDHMIVERWKKSMGYLFVLECNHTQPGKVIQVSFSFFNFVICRTTRFVEIQQFCYHVNVT